MSGGSQGPTNSNNFVAKKNIFRHKNILWWSCGGGPVAVQGGQRRINEVRGIRFRLVILWQDFWVFMVESMYIRLV